MGGIIEMRGKTSEQFFKKEFMKMTSSTLKSKYELYKKIPMILSLITFGFFALTAIVLAVALYSFLTFLLTAALGALISVVCYFLMTVITSPLVITADYILSLESASSETVYTKPDNSGIPKNVTPPVINTRSKGKRWLCKHCGAFNDGSQVECQSCYNRKE